MCNKKIWDKIICNSYLPIIGNNFYTVFDKNKANEITTQSKNLIREANNIINNYFKNK